MKNDNKTKDERIKDKAQSLLDLAGVIFITINSEGYVTFINKKGCEILKCSENEIVGKNWFDNFIPEKKRAETKSVFNQLMADEIEPVEYFENPVLTNNGDERIIAWHNTVMRDNTGTIVGTLSSGGDVTERKIVEEALMVSERRFRELADLLPQSVFEVGLKGNFLFANRFFHETAEYTQEDIDNGLNVAQLVIPEDRWRVKENISKILKGEKSRGNEYTGLSKSGKIFPVIIYSKPVYHKGKVIGLRGIVVDITERKKAEQRIIEERNLARLYLDLMGHDINNINQAIMTTAELLMMNKDLPKNIRKYLENLLQHSKKITDLVANVTKLANLKKGDIQETIIDVADVISKSLDRITQKYSKSEIIINHSLGESGVKTKSNEMLQDLFDNILDNAVKYDNHEKKVIDITHVLLEDGGFWKFEFKDRGPGVPDEMKDIIFKRMEKGVESIHGSGLGLSVVNEVVKSSGGKVWVQDRIAGDLGKGSNFVVLLPKGE